MRSCEFLYHMHNYVFKCWKQISLRRLMSTASVHHIFKNIKFRRFNFRIFRIIAEINFPVNVSNHCIYWMIGCCNDGSQSTFMYIQLKYELTRNTNHNQLAEEHVESKIWFSSYHLTFLKSVVNRLKINMQDFLDSRCFQAS